MARITALTDKELSAFGGPAELRIAVNTELEAFKQHLIGDGHGWYDDDQCHEMINARLYALPEHGPERTAIQKQYEMLLAIVDDGVADVRSDDELIYFIDEFMGVRHGID
jgi:hypothetical protein